MNFRRCECRSCEGERAGALQTADRGSRDSRHVDPNRRGGSGAKRCEVARHRATRRRRGVDGAGGNSIAAAPIAATSISANRSDRDRAAALDEERVQRETAFAFVEHEVARRAASDRLRLGCVAQRFARHVSGARFRTKWNKARRKAELCREMRERRVATERNDDVETAQIDLHRRRPSTSAPLRHREVPQARRRAFRRTPRRGDLRDP